MADENDKEDRAEGSKRRTNKQERALYQPGKGLSNLRRSETPQRSSENIERCGANTEQGRDPMDAVKKKLDQMSLRGPPANAMRRYGQSQDNRRFENSRGDNRGPRDLWRSNDGYRGQDRNWRQRGPSPSRDERFSHRDRGSFTSREPPNDNRGSYNSRESVNDNRGSYNSRESVNDNRGSYNSREFSNDNRASFNSRESFNDNRSFREPRQRRDSASSQMSNGPASWSHSSGNQQHQRRNNYEDDRWRDQRDFGGSHRQLWEDDRGQSRADPRNRPCNQNRGRNQQDSRNGRDDYRPNVNRRNDFGQNATDRNYPQRRNDFRGMDQNRERPRNDPGARRNFDGDRQRSDFHQDNDSKPSGSDIDYGTNNEPLHFIDTPTEKKAEPELTDWSQCPTPPPLDELQVLIPEVQERSSETEPPELPDPDVRQRGRVRQDSETSSWSHYSGSSMSRHDNGNRRNRDRSGGRRNSRGEHRSPRKSPYRDKKQKEFIAPRFQRQREEEQQCTNRRDAPERWERLPSSNQRSQNWRNEQQKPSDKSRNDPNYRGDNGSREKDGLSKPLMSVRPIPQVSESSSQGEQRQVKGAVERNLQEAQYMENDLSKILREATEKTGGISELSDLRAKIQLRYEQVILHDPRFSVSKNVEQLLWKSVYHQVIESLRLAEDYEKRSSKETRPEILSIVEEGLQYYEGLLERMQELHGLKLDEIAQTDQNLLSGTVKMMLISAQKTLICLGDLCRYREQALHSANFGKARDFYLRAQRLAPKNGKPYNQLALLAVYSRRKLDAVYYYMRSLAASNPLLTAKESLTTLFDEIRKKCDLERQKKLQETTNLNAHMALPESARCEIWIRPDGTSWQRRGDSQLEKTLDMIDELNSMNDIDLMKQFTSSFLHVHGKLFSKIGMEYFSEAAKQMLLEFRTLLKRPLGPSGGARCLQLLAICMFSVSNNSLKHTATLDSNARSLMQELSVQIAMAFVTHVMERSKELLDEHLLLEASARTSYLPGDVEELLPVLKIWADWMSGHKMLWCPPPNPCDFSTATKGNVWTAYAELLNALSRVDSVEGNENKINFVSSKTAEEPMEVILPEDKTMAGFVPLLVAPVDSFFSAECNEVQLPRLRSELRISRLNYFGDYLCGLEDPYLAFDVQRSVYESLIVDHARAEGIVDEEDNGPNEYESQTTSPVSSEAEEPSDNDAECSDVEKLRKKKLHLQKKMRKNNRVKAYIEKVLHNNRSTTILEIRPRYLVPDTNCLVDHLDLVRRLIAFKTFSIYIPIVVVNELDGLARGTRNASGARAHQEADHAARVTVFANDALNFLKEKFAEREPKLRTITSRGNLLDSMAFRNEVGQENAGTNDDVILASVITLCKAPHLQPGETEHPLKLFSEAVLLTEDRNLAVKAISHNVPVRDICSFVRWSQIP